MQGTTLHSSTGIYTLGKRIAGGGEGDIYEVSGAQALLAKVYKSGKATPERQAKLQIMLANPPDNPTAGLGHESIAWPKDLLFRDSGRSQFSGFLMPRVAALSSISEVYHVPTRKRRFPGFNWKYLVATARNMSSAVSALHDKGYVVGDLNESNIMVTDRALVSVIDVDSMQVADPATGRVYRCIVGKPEYTAPEISGASFSSVDRRIEQDCFSLAVLIFVLLMEGRHPFDGRDSGPGEQPPYHEMIRRNWFGSAHLGTGGNIRPPKGCPPFSMLPPDIRDLFARCFVDGANNPSVRPKAEEWTQALDHTLATLVSCSNNSQHVFGHHLKDCPWCERIRRLRIKDPFPAPPVRKGHQVPLTPIAVGMPQQAQPSAGTGAVPPQTGQAGAQAAAQAVQTTRPTLPTPRPTNYWARRKWVGLLAILALAPVAFFAIPRHGVPSPPAGGGVNLPGDTSPESTKLVTDATVILDDVEKRMIQLNKLADENAVPPDIEDIIATLKARCQQAEQKSVAAIRMGADTPKAHLCLIESRRFAGRYSAALDAANVAVRKFPDDPAIKRELGLLRHRR